jgi:hypothetical protein
VPVKASIKQGLLVASWAWLAMPCAAGAVQYTWASTNAGDTVGITSWNDRGDLVLEGSGGSCRGSAYQLYDATARRYSNWVIVTGLPRGDPVFDDECGVRVAARNSAGEMIGTSNVRGTLVPTYWTGDVAYDLTDTANAALVGAFVPDPFAVRAPGVDVDAFDILNAPPGLRPMSSQFVNGLGMYVVFARTSNYHNDAFVLIPLTVPVPGTWALTGVALLALAASRRGFAFDRSRLRLGKQRILRGPVNGR